MALTLVLMVLFAGFAVDVSNWWLRAERIQRAADSGAHAGVVFLPADLGNATTRAKGEVAKNGYGEGGGYNTAIAVTQEANPNRLRVKVTADVPSYFLGLIGIDKIRMTPRGRGRVRGPRAHGLAREQAGQRPGPQPELPAVLDQHGRAQLHQDLR